MPVIRAFFLHTARAGAAQTAHAQRVRLGFGQRIAAGGADDFKASRCDIHGFRVTARSSAADIAHEILRVHRPPPSSSIADDCSSLGDHSHGVAKALVIAAQLRPVTAKPPRDPPEYSQKQNQIDENAHSQKFNGFMLRQMLETSRSCGRSRIGWWLEQRY